MARLRKSWGGGALVAALALTLGACTTSSDDKSDSPSTGAGGQSAHASGGGNAGQIVVTNGTEPQNPLLPGMTSETGGGRIVDSLTARLVYYKADGSTAMELAESIETTDSKTYTVTIKPDQKFSSGEPINAAAFVDSWNYIANSKNGQLASSFFEPIQGYADVSRVKDTGEKGEDGEPIMEPDPAAETMSGLRIVDDTTFTITLEAAQADFPLRLGYTAFAPLPPAAFEDMEAFGSYPAASGPYMMASADAWQHNVQLELVPNPSYQGDRKPANAGVRFVFYASYDAAYADLQAGVLDVQEGLPDAALATYQDDLGDRSINQPAAIIETFTIPERLPHFSGEEGKLRRQAISLAIDRSEITSTLYYGTRTPAVDYTSPVVTGWSDSVPGNEVLQFNADKAKELWAQADAISPWEGTFELAYNSDGPHQGWVDAVCNQLKNTLGIDAAGKPYPTFAELRKDITGRTIQTPFRSGWQGDYPSAANFLIPKYSSSAADGNGSNDGDYKNPAFDDLLAQAAAAPTVAESTELLAQAQSLLFEDLPSIPLWYRNAFGGYSEAVDNVAFGWDQQPLYYQVTKK